VARAASKISKGGGAGPGFKPRLPTLASRKATPKVALFKKKHRVYSNKKILSKISLLQRLPYLKSQIIYRVDNMTSQIWEGERII
jgi:hypothetical protein